MTNHSKSFGFHINKTTKYIDDFNVTSSNTKVATVTKGKIYYDDGDFLTEVVPRNKGTEKWYSGYVDIDAKAKGTSTIRVSLIDDPSVYDVMTITVINGKLSVSEPTIDIAKGTAEKVAVFAVNSHKITYLVSNKNAVSVKASKFDSNTCYFTITRKATGTAKIKILFVNDKTICQEIKVNVVKATTTTTKKVDPLDVYPRYYDLPSMATVYFGADPGEECYCNVTGSSAYKITSVKIVSGEIQQRYYTSDEDVIDNTSVRFENNPSKYKGLQCYDPVIYGTSTIPGDYTIKVKFYCEDLDDTITLTTRFVINPPDGGYRPDKGLVTVYF